MWKYIKYTFLNCILIIRKNKIKCIILKKYFYRFLFSPNYYRIYF